MRGSWKEQGHRLTSVFLCACAVVFGTLLYPLVLLFFSVIALVYPLLRGKTPDNPSSTRGASVKRSEA